MSAKQPTLYPTATELKGNHTVERINTSQFPHYAKQQLRDAKLQQAEARTNAALATDAWSTLDATAYDTFEATTVLVQDLLNAGLDHEADFMSEFDFWQTRDTHGSAEVGMTVEATTSDSAVSYGKDGSPIPVIHDDFVVRYREGASGDADARGGTDEDLETTGVSGASRRVSETIERLFIGDEDLEFAVNNGQDIVELHGITTHPEVPTETADTNWTTEPETIRSDLRRLRSILKNDNHVSPGNVGYNVYLGTDWYDALDDADPEGTGDMSVRDRVDNLANINQITELDFMDPESAMMLRPTEDVIEVGVANDVQTLQWDGPFSENFKVLASMYPRIKVTEQNQVGIAYMTA